jgi:hypothetical protein
MYADQSPMFTSEAMVATAEGTSQEKKIVFRASQLENKSEVSEAVEAYNGQSQQVIVAFSLKPNRRRSYWMPGS